MNYFLKEAALKAAILEAVAPCGAIGITGQELAEACIDTFHHKRIEDLMGIANDIKRITKGLVARGEILEQIEEEEYDGGIYRRCLYWPIPKLSCK